MSTGTKRAYYDAVFDIGILVGKLEDACDAWTVAGSIRRHRPEVGDVEHVVTPTVREDQEGLIPGFGAGEMVNLLWQRLDLLVADSKSGITKAVYPDGKHRWGEKYRGIMFRDFRHEFFAADKDNFGCILAIRTGPADLSEHLVTQLKIGGRYRQQDGYLRYATGASAGQVRPVPTEEEFFRLCGVPFVPAQDRDDWRRAMVVRR